MAEVTVRNNDDLNNLELNGNQTRTSPAVPNKSLPQPPPLFVTHVWITVVLTCLEKLAPSFTERGAKDGQARVFPPVPLVAFPLPNR